MPIIYREETLPADVDAVRSLVESTGFFTPEEVGVSIELVEERLAKGSPSGYSFIFLENEGHVVLGYSCFGPIPCTNDSFDLYWLAVRKDCQNSGLGTSLLERTEQAISLMDGAKVYIETSSRELYLPTREFYQRNGYRQEARFKDFYAPGDDKIVYVKQLLPAGNAPL
ncbi:MAG: GNAT family N-acetyltransferase [Desulfomonilia bacterium]|nr:GNAT family N-acetyltransferase [Desulfomonilia bacterium]